MHQEPTLSKDMFVNSSEIGEAIKSSTLMGDEPGPFPRPKEPFLWDAVSLCSLSLLHIIDELA